jgi:hypothetical protein
VLVASVARDVWMYLGGSKFVARDGGVRKHKRNGSTKKYPENPNLTFSFLLEIQSNLQFLPFRGFFPQMQ